MYFIKKINIIFKKNQFIYNFCYKLKLLFVDALTILIFNENYNI
jgi:hypothetical protein